MRSKLSRIREGLADPQTAFDKARELAEQAVNLEKVNAVYVGAAIDNLTREGDFGSWLKKLYRGEKVSIHLHYYERLVRIVEDRADMVRRRADHVQYILETTGAHHATSRSSGRVGQASAEACAA